MGATTLDEISVSSYLINGPLLNVDNYDTNIKNIKTLGAPLDMEIHSSINGFYRYGSISFYDDGGIRESLPLTGNEIISIMYRNNFRSGNNASGPTVAYFNIFDIEEINFSPDAMDSKKFTAKILKFNIIEAPFFLIYNSTLWQKTFGSDTGDDKTSTKMRINKIFEKHILEDLKIYSTSNVKNFIELNFDEMATSLHFNCPSWKSQVLFSYLLDFCKDKDNYGNVKFYPTSNTTNGKIVLNLKSLNSLFKNKKSVEFVMGDMSALDDMKNKIYAVNNKILNQILQYKFLYYDITTVTNGLAGAYMMNYDYKTGRYYTLNENYENSNNKTQYASNYALWKNDISNENTRQYYMGSIDKTLAKSYLNNKVVKNRHQLRCEFVTYVDENIQVGDKITAIFMSGMNEYSRDKSTHLFDEHMTDDWIVEDIVDTYKDGRGMRKMIVMKDSFFNLYTPNSGSSASILPSVNSVNKV